LQGGPERCEARAGVVSHTCDSPPSLSGRSASGAIRQSIMLKSTFRFQMDASSLHQADGVLHLLGDHMMGDGVRQR
jgi:hypothetical protein